jgi:hypothetical protein
MIFDRVSAIVAPRLVSVCLAVLCLAATPASADSVTKWMFKGRDISEAAMNGPIEWTERHLTWRSHTALAMFEALNAPAPRYRSYLKVPKTPAASGDAAAIQAAHDVLIHYYPEHKAELDRMLSEDLAALPEKGKAAGITFGQQVAKASLAAGGRDPMIKPVPYKPHTTPGIYVPTASLFFPDWFQCMKPWFLNGASELRPPAPISLSSTQWADDYNEIRRFGAKTGSERTADQTEMARFWNNMDTDFILDQVASQPGRRPVDNARLFALVAMANEDTWLIKADAKLRYNFWRPVTAIRNGEIDGNDATTAVADWEPLLKTPMHPEYPCGHCLDGYLFATLLKADTKPGQTFAFTTPSVPGVTRTVTLDRFAEETSLSRIYGGIHFRSTNAISDKLGIAIAERAMASFAQPLRR